MNEQYIRALVKFTKSSSASVLDATIDHLVHGETQDAAADKHSVKQEAIARLVKRIKSVETKIDEIIKLKK